MSLPARSKAADTGVCSQRAVAPRGPMAGDSHRIPGPRSEELKRTSEHDGGIRSQDSSDLSTDARTEPQSSRPASKRQKRDAEAVGAEDVQKGRLLMAALSQEQLNRYEAYRGAGLPRAAVKRVIDSASGTSVSQNVVIAMAGLAKVFVGEVVEEALDVCEKWGETTPLQPKHLREAVRRLRSKGKIPKTKPKNVLF